MTTLLRFNLKENKGVFFENSLIRKFYFSLKKNFYPKSLTREYNGYKWYFSILKKKKIVSNFRVKKIKNKLELSLIKGKQFRYLNNIVSFDEKVILNIFSQYKLIWPKKKLVPFHGDLTIENIVYLKNKLPIFIDWENYKKKEIWGLDICYFLISLLTLPAISKNKFVLEKTELEKFSYYWKKFFLKKDHKYIKRPIDFLKKKIVKKNSFIFKIPKSMEKQILYSIL